MSAYQKHKWRRVLNEYKFYKEEILLIKNLNRSTSPEFKEYCESFLEKNNLSLKELTDQSEQNQQEQEELKPQELGTPEECPKLSPEEVEIHNQFSKLFKKIAIKIHPDKIDVMKHSYNERRKMETDFKTANKALEDKEYLILIDIAEQLNVPLPKNYDQQSRWMKRKIKEIEQDLSTERQTYNYIFSEKETEQEKDEVVKAFLRQMFGINI